MLKSKNISVQEMNLVLFLNRKSRKSSVRKTRTCTTEKRRSSRAEENRERPQGNREAGEICERR